MALTPGTRLGVYEITAQINAVDQRVRARYDVSTDGRFLMGVPSAEQSVHISVILNWSQAQRR